MLVSSGMMGTHVLVVLAHDKLTDMHVAAGDNDRLADRLDAEYLRETLRQGVIKREIRIPQVWANESKG